ncbi:MAG TPA: questin oxidase family protein, partial [Vicinamibacteria bacterium]|nr:questin oxidase family protein [Vicinamibacteria bacterium]
ERRDVLRGAAAFAAASAAGRIGTSASDDGALDLALERFARTGPEYWGGLANHGPMAAEALVAVGRPQAVARWVDGYVSRLEPPPAPATTIAPVSWKDALGRPERVADWAVLFRRELAEGPWRDVLRRWVPRLAPGFIAAATHGAIRTGHAARALESRQTPPRIHELAEGLAYWAANYTPLPESAAPEGRARPSQAVETLELLPAARRRSGGLITARLAGLYDLPSFPDVASRVAVGGDPSAFFSDLTATFARIYLENATPGKVITFVHAVTGPSAARLLVPYADEAGRRALMRYAWQAAAALYVAMGDRPSQPPREPDPPSAETLVDQALANGDEHAIKLTEACLREDAIRPRPVYRVAARDAITRL